MNQWSRTRKRIILAIALFAVFILVGLPMFFLFYNKPTCSDGAMNGDETGIDCGGSCQRLCTAESLPLIVRGDARVLTVASSTYEVIAVIENPNPTADIYRAEYTFRLYGSTSAIPVKVIEGLTFVPKATSFALFEGPFNLEEGVLPTRATLEWKPASLVWRKNTAPVPEIEVSDVVLSGEERSPRLTAAVRNISLETVSNVDFVALLSDEEGSIFAASKTYVESLDSGESTPILFTWPRPFTQSTINVEIIKRILPDSSFIR